MIIFENENFIVEYKPETAIMTVSYFEDGHYKEEASFTFVPK